VIAWTTAEAAIKAWAAAGSGLASDHVIWSRQGGPRPSGAFISMSILSVRPVGRDWVHTRDATVPAEGAEIVHVAQGVREAALRLQCFAGTATGATTPQALLEAVVAAAKLPTRRAALIAAGVGILSMGTVLPIDGVIGSSVFEPRAVLEVRLLVSSEVTETGTFVESVEVTNDVTEESFSVEAP
jgi:hypothetical protein